MTLISGDVDEVRVVFSGRPGELRDRPRRWRLRPGCPTHGLRRSERLSAPDGQRCADDAAPSTTIFARTVPYPGIPNRTRFCVGVKYKSTEGNREGEAASRRSSRVRGPLVAPRTRCAAARSTSLDYEESCGGDRRPAPCAGSGSISIVRATLLTTRRCGTGRALRILHRARPFRKRERRPELVTIDEVRSRSSRAR